MKDIILGKVHLQEEGRLMTCCKQKKYCLIRGLEIKGTRLLLDRKPSCKANMAL